MSILASAASDGATMGSLRTDSSVLVELSGAREVRASSASVLGRRKLAEMSSGWISPSVTGAEETASPSSGLSTTEGAEMAVARSANRL